MSIFIIRHLVYDCEYCYLKGMYLSANIVIFVNIEDVLTEVESILKDHNAGIGYFGPHEELNPNKIHGMVITNLEVPLVLSQLLLRDLKKSKGYIINISSITAKKSSAYGCAYSATKAGLAHFSEGLFDETRKTGVKVITIYPDITKTNFYKDLNFRQGDLPESYILPECIADAVEMVLSQREGTVVTEIILQPQKHMIARK